MGKLSDPYLTGKGVTSPRSRPTLKTIAEMTGLGVTTVSRALKDAPDIGAKTKERVRKVADAVGYHPDRAGVRLRTGKTNVISLILDQTDKVPEFARRMIVGISEAIRGTPYHLVVTPQSRLDDPMDPVRYILETRAADGVILTHIRPDDERVHALRQSRLPFVTHGRCQTIQDHAYHDFDNRAFCRMAAERMIKRGRNRLALLAPPSEFSYYQETLAGLAEIAEPANIPFKVLPGVDLDSSIEVLRQAGMALRHQEYVPDGIICGSELCAMALIDGMTQSGLEVGKHADVIAKETSDLLDLTRPRIDSLREDLIVAGQQLASHLLDVINGAEPDTLQTLSEPKPVWRVNQS
ncbi:LacI family transcriptional regulator [Thalassospira sp. GO-4]|uniref:LacI family transcriptional regulator n=1 Tax=Thalassospira sp. GO-4 TaxID=2946605 RepID=UPI002024F5A8|nr:LacI family transcriptional regulator [Thalassospira sp. GO-4]URK17636.1 LacI family transcriptional regulator [Thalassospira sp. GO-4]